MKCFVMLIFFVALSGLNAQPLDDIVERRLVKERRVLAYPPIREADIFWEKRVWRVIDIREKMNQTFAYPPQPFFSLLADGAKRGEVPLYSAEEESFGIPLDSADLNGILYRVDTFEVVNPETMIPELRVAVDEINPENVKRFRLKEVWYFDEQRSALQVRILGIAPLIEVFDEHGNFRYERPLFWVYYPELRDYLAQYTVFNPGNDNSMITWEDLMEMRFFSSTIYKKSNIHDRRLSEYVEGVDRLQEAEKLKQELFNFEHDLWSY